MITATRLGGPPPLPPDLRACTRCGIVREVNKRTGDMCRDCREVEYLLTLPQPVDRHNCGTISGYQAHKRHREGICPDCQVAMRDYRRDMRRRSA